eukprot:TRINITY_DN24010_c0_g1_i1.p1 TRINITY_DN24010_c0_g1~~TRINITY_DN24010_c0_g1_i1.p1  ORF type:complete len:105 (-),score=28.03 TRINITY_DN24010_c0_g1_i1:5-319(-)
MYNILVNQHGPSPQKRRSGCFSACLTLCWLPTADLNSVLPGSGGCECEPVPSELFPSKEVLRPHLHMDLCLLYTSDAADDLLCVDLGGRRIIKKKKASGVHYVD